MYNTDQNQSRDLGQARNANTPPPLWYLELYNILVSNNQKKKCFFDRVCFSNVLIFSLNIGNLIRIHLLLSGKRLVLLSFFLFQKVLVK